MRLCFAKVTCTILGIILAISVGGCYSSTSGTIVDKDKLSQINKGVTTRSQVESFLGHPDSVSPMADGRQVMIYQGTEAKGSNDEKGLIPIIGGIIPQHDNTSIRRQTLRIYLDSNDVVEDYHLDDTTQDTKVTATMFGAHGETTSTPNNGTESAQK